MSLLGQRALDDQCREMPVVIPDDVQRHLLAPPSTLVHNTMLRTSPQSGRTWWPTTSDRVQQPSPVTRGC